MKQKIIVLSSIISLFLVFSLTTVIHAEPDYSDTEYWNNLCTGSASLSYDQRNACSAYMTYLQGQTGNLSDTLKQLETERKEMALNVEKYAEEARQWQAQADVKQGEINTLNTKITGKQNEIDAMQVRIDEKQLEIEAKEAEVVTIEEKLKGRIALSQSSMRINRTVDLFLGASSFDQLLRIQSGLSAIANSDEETIDELFELIEQLNADKEELEGLKTNLEAAKVELQNQKAEVVKAQEELLALKYRAQMLEEEAQKKAAELEAQGNKVAANIEAINAQMKEIAAQLNSVASAYGWTFPVPGSVRSAGTWAYPSGGLHLGYDFAAPVGTPILAVANGVVINRADGCPTGYLGSACGYQYGGSSGGGNQIYLLTIVNNNLYAIKYLHMLAGTPIAQGSVVQAGQQIGSVGSSGNSSGAHCHIEIFYLGDGANFSYYAQNWNGDLAFGCGWGGAALGRLCDNGVGAPCRIRPESVFSG